ncbi:MAG TPA: hypothetical protein VJY62_02410 [Bacteroidia bacterium]|nr:hypothetical protein [Bacteroidia bacterium]
MGLPNINFIFRILTKAGYTTKGSELTWLEHDTNWEILIDTIQSLNSTGNVAPYSPGQAYPFNDSNGNPIPSYVSYLGNIYLFVGTPYQTGVTPGTNPAIWQLVSTGTLSHIQNTDQYLDLGGPNEISANALKTLYLNQVILTTRAGFNTLVSTSALRGGYLYLLIDVAIALRSITSNRFDHYGHLFVDYTASGLRGTLEVERVNYDPVADVIYERYDNYGNVVKNSVAGATSFINTAPWGYLNFTGNTVEETTMTAAFSGTAMLGSTFKDNVIKNCTITNSMTAGLFSFIQNTFLNSSASLTAFSQIEKYRCENSSFSILGTGSSSIRGATITGGRTINSGANVTDMHETGVSAVYSADINGGVLQYGFSNIVSNVAITGGNVLDVNGTNPKEKAGVLDLQGSGVLGIDTINTPSFNYTHEVLARINSLMTLDITSGVNISLPSGVSSPLSLDGAANDWFKYRQSATGQFQITQYFKS